MAHKNPKQSNFVYIIIGIIAAILLAAGGYYFGVKSQTPNDYVLGTTTTPTKAGAVASAAYSKCIQNGGFVTTSRKEKNGYYQVCNFADDMNCDLYALYDGDCPIGGVHTIGYSTTAQVYCALRGGTPQGSENGQCKMPDGKICSTASVYNGTCSPN